MIKKNIWPLLIVLLVLIVGLVKYYNNDRNIIDNQNVSDNQRKISVEDKKQKETSNVWWEMLLGLNEKNPEKIKILLNIEKEKSLPTEEKEKIVKKIKKVKSKVAKVLWLKKTISPMGLAINLKMYKSDIEELGKYYKLKKELDKVSDPQKKAKLENIINKKIQEISKQLADKWLLKEEIEALNNFAKLPEQERKKLNDELDSIMVNVIEETWEIVSPEFKQKYEETKMKIIEMTKSQLQSNQELLWEEELMAIPYEVVINYMIKEELIKAWKCDLLENPIDIAECKFLNK